MKILIVCSGNSNSISPFIKDQVDSLIKLGIEADYFLIKGIGAWGYLKNLKLLKLRIKNDKPDIIHAHYGLSGLLSTFQRKVPVVITFHGSDVNNKKERYFSWVASRFSAANIFVSQKLMKLLPAPNSFLIPCGVDMELFKPTKKKDARVKLGLQQDKKYILFSSNFNNKVKNYSLAKAAIALLLDEDIKLIELKGYNRKQVAILMNAVDLVLMTSVTEGSPQFIKEAMACNTAIVSTDVGDVNEILNNVEGTYICSYTPEDVAEKINLALKFGKKTNGRKKLNKFDLDSVTVAKAIINIYKCQK